MRQLTAGDRVGIGWRPDLAAGILAHLDRIDLIEVIADDHFDAPRSRLRALRTLAAQVPVTLHGVGMGPASVSPIDPVRAGRLARLVAAIGPESWSEHLAFVRAGGIEIGHLAAPPRTPQSVDGAARNLAALTRLVGTPPLVENIATLVRPPASTMAEAEWVGGIAAAAGVDLLLDLHNLYANAVNFGDDPEALLRSFPLDRVAAVHISGGVFIAEPGGAGQRLLDDHWHDVPAEVYRLLALLAKHSRRPLSVILERDGHYPDFATLLGQIDRARAALQIGRAAAALPEQQVGADEFACA